MKLVFFKENEDIKLKLNNNGTDEEFSYVKLIKFLHVGNELEETEYNDDISDEEKSKIKQGELCWWRSAYKIPIKTSIRR